MTASEVSRLIEVNQKVALELAASYLQQTTMPGLHPVPRGESPDYGARTDSDKFLLYSADTPEVRHLNETRGLEGRANAIGARADSWKAFSAAYDDTVTWGQFTDEQRAAALQQVTAGHTPGQQQPAPALPHPLGPLHVVYETPGVETRLQQPPHPPGHPSPAPGPAPAP